ncbi:protein translocase subunit SecF [Patescibacteria group bacterium]|nr:protein translocase subunit SecF [Patescibacteria group bacterium]MBU4346929.1 protein translocase subunit SecF [Patescibacteria group bacterium]MBU4455655.1 protein translocase subunit SecF [Patescibacteria group bacterium]MCG2690728.1 protein translocase subunit SecF [Candidatus Parcubacteria bacterium]
MYQVIQKRKIWLTVSGLMVGLSIAALAVWGLNFGIDFTGGSLIEVKFLNERPAASEARQALGDLDLGSLIVQPAGDDGMIFRFQDTAEEKHQQVLTALNRLSTIEELRYDSVGPSIGQELKTKSLYAAVIVIIAIILYIAWSFRKVSKPVASWKYGLAANIALFHDVMIVLGVFAVLGEFAGVEVNTPFVAAILTVLGYSVNDTIVVFDRIRENLPKSGEDFENTVNISINQTFSRSINTVLTTLLVLLSIFFFGGSTIRDFALALSIGVFVGAYSSIFLASPILVIWEKLKNRV